MALESTKFAAGFAAPLGVRNAQTGQDLTPRAQRSIRMLSEELPLKMTLEDVKAGKLSPLEASCALTLFAHLQKPFIPGIKH